MGRGALRYYKYRRVRNRWGLHLRGLWGHESEMWYGRSLEKGIVGKGWPKRWKGLHQGLSAQGGRGGLSSSGGTGFEM